MQEILKKLKKSLNKIIRRIYISKSCRRYNKYFYKRFQAFNGLKSSKELVLVVFTESYPMIFTFSCVATVLSKKYCAKLKYFNFSSTKLDFFKVPNMRTEFLYNTFGCRRGISWKDTYRYKSYAKVEAKKILFNLNSKWDLVRLKYKNLMIGEIIYDTYLRRMFKETCNIKDKKLLDYIYQAVLIVEFTENYLKSNRVKAIIVGDVAYIYSGVIARVGVKLNIPVYNIIDSDGLLINKIEEPHFYRRKFYWNYKNQFKRFNESEKKEKRLKAKSNLEFRLSGGIDPNMRYITFTSFKEKTKYNVLSNSDNQKILILLHCFFDSPHIYRYMLFPDFWEWIVFTLRDASKTNFEWYVKPHPNGLPQNCKIIEKLKLMFPKANYIDPNISNSELIASNVRSIFTVYGSAGHEFAYLGLHVVNSGDNPHISYRFNINPKNIEEYSYCIANADNLKISIDQKEIEEIYYMHYLHPKPFYDVQPIYPNEKSEKYLTIPATMKGKEKRIAYHFSEKSLDFIINNYSSGNELTYWENIEKCFQENLEYR